MKTQCTGEQLEFHALGRRLVTGRFDGGRISSDAGGVVLREVDKRIGLTERVSRCLLDYRNPASVEHSVHELASQRLYGIALGYEDLNDHGELRCDALLSLLVGKRDVTGQTRIRERDRGYALASASTLNRMELGEPEAAAHDRYKRIVACPDEFDELLVEFFVESHSRAPREIWLDLDATDDPLHGHQEGRFFHGYYGCYCYLPLYIFCGEHLLCARLRESNQDASAGSIEELERIIGQIRRHWPRTRIHIRGDSGFCRDSLMKWCEENDVGFVLGLARNQRLTRALGAAMHEARSAHRRTGNAAGRLRDFTYRTRKSWSRSRRVVGKAEYLSKGENPRFVVTNLSPRKAAQPPREAGRRSRVRAGTQRAPGTVPLRTHGRQRCGRGVDRFRPPRRAGRGRNRAATGRAGALQDRRGLAPFDGFTGLTEMVVGDRIGTGDAITTLDDRASLLVGIAVPELFLGRIGKEHPVRVATWAAREQAIPGEIADVDSRIDPASRSFTARARVANPNDAFRPGMSFAVTLDLLGIHYPLVPEIAVRYGTDGAFVWVVREGAAARVAVRIVQRQEATVLVDAALEDGEPVVVEGIQRLRPGLAVDVAAPGQTS